MNGWWAEKIDRFRQFLEKCMQLPDSVGWGAVKGEMAVFEGCVCTDHQYIQRRGRETDRKTANSHPTIPVVAVSTGCVHWLCVISCLVCEPSSKDIHVYRFETYTWNSAVHVTTHHLACHSVIGTVCMYILAHALRVDAPACDLVSQPSHLVP